MDDSEPNSSRGTKIDEAVGFSDGEGYRLFHQNMLSGDGYTSCNLGVASGRRANRHHVDQRVPQESVEIIDSCDSKPACEPSRSRLVRIEDRMQTNVRQRLEVACMPPAHAAASDDAKANGSLSVDGDWDQTLPSPWSRRMWSASLIANATIVRVGLA
jgi:hypothetical protein